VSTELLKRSKYFSRVSVSVGAHSYLSVGLGAELGAGSGVRGAGTAVLGASPDRNGLPNSVAANISKGSTVRSTDQLRGAELFLRS
jgi:hypothetical protein